MSVFHTVAHIDDIPEGQGRLFVVAGRMIGVFHSGGAYFALDNRCPHEEAPLSRGRVAEGVVTCAMHHWRFRLRDGVWLDRDDPAHNAVVFPVRVEGGLVQVGLPEA